MDRLAVLLLAVLVYRASCQSEGFGESVHSLRRQQKVIDAAQSTQDAIFRASTGTVAGGAQKAARTGNALIAAATDNTVTNIGANGRRHLQQQLLHGPQVTLLGPQVTLLGADSELQGLRTRRLGAWHEDAA